MLLIGGLEDQIVLLVWGKVSNTFFSLSNLQLGEFTVYQRVFSGLMHPFSTTRPLLEFFVSSLFSLFGPGMYNLLLVLILSTNILVSYWFFKKYRFGLVYSLIFSLSAYFWIHLIHLSILFLWMIPLFFGLAEKFRKKSSWKNAAVLGLLLSVFFLMSNYLGFFLCVFYGLLLLSQFLMGGIVEKEWDTSLLKNGFVSLVSFVFLTLLLLSPYLISSYVTKTNDTGWLTLGSKTRPYEDFFSFSSRPWYFLTPAEKNPILGSFATTILNKFEDTGYFLADDYFGGEHAANFFGYTFLLTFFIVLLVGFRNLSRDTKKEIGIYALLILFLLIIMLPPYFTISGIKIYTPMHLVYYMLPMFRVTARLSIFVLFLMLLILATVVEDLVTVSRKAASVLRIFMPFLLLVTMLEVFVPPSIYKKDAVPFVYSYMAANTQVDTIFAVYPYDKTADALFWLDEHQRLLLNPRGYKDGAFDAAVFTENLTTIEGLELFSNMGGDYLVVFKDISDAELVHFIDNPYYELNVELPGSYLFSRVLTEN